MYFQEVVMKTFAKVLYVIFGILIIIGGLYCLFTPGITYLTIGYLVGISMVVDAIGRFINWGQLKNVGQGDPWILVSAILSLVMGCIVLGSAGLQLGIDVFLVYYIAIWMAIKGIVIIVRAIKIHHGKLIFDGASWATYMLLGWLTLLFGVLCMFNPILLASTIGIFMGLGIIAVGASMITLATTKEV